MSCFKIPLCFEITLKRIFELIYFQMKQNHNRRTMHIFVTDRNGFFLIKRAEKLRKIHTVLNWIIRGYWDMDRAPGYIGARDPWRWVERATRRKFSLCIFWHDFSSSPWFSLISPLDEISTFDRNGHQWKNKQIRSAKPQQQNIVKINTQYTQYYLFNFNYQPLVYITIEINKHQNLRRKYN